jgi:hypothetical protein
MLFVNFLRKSILFQQYINIYEPDNKDNKPDISIIITYPHTAIWRMSTCQYNLTPYLLLLMF